MEINLETEAEIVVLVGVVKKCIKEKEKFRKK